LLGQRQLAADHHRRAEADAADIGGDSGVNVQVFHERVRAAGVAAVTVRSID
jgi:hypothetical protein